MKKVKYFLFILVCIFSCGVVFAQNDVVIKSITPVYDENSGIVLTNENGTDGGVVFNDENQSIKYNVVIENTTEKDLSVQSINLTTPTEGYLKYELEGLNGDDIIKANSTKEVVISLNIVQQDGWGRNFNDELTATINLGDPIINPSTNTGGNVIFAIVIAIVLAVCMIGMIITKNKKLMMIIVLITSLVYLIPIVKAKDTVTLMIKTNASYKSQNLLQGSGITIVDYEANYTDATDVWKYSKSIKNIIISEKKEKPENYEYEFDLTITDSKRIMGYLVENGDSKIPYDLYIVSSGVVYAPENSTGLFSFPNVETIKGLEKIIFDNTTNMSGMFLGDTLLKEASFKSINFENVEDATCMFKETPVTIDHINAEYIDNIKYKDYMFGVDLYRFVKDGTTSDIDTNFKLAPVAGKYYIEETKNEMNPIYYYRGNVTNNNVIFADICWQIVRTTDTGGIKLIYNGIPGENGTCQTPSVNSNIGLSRYNLKTASPSYVGYMYGEEYESKKKLPSEVPEKCIYGNDVEWDGSKYVLKDTFTSNSFSSDMKQIQQKYHYTCFNDSGQCSEVYYINSYNTTQLYYLTLQNGENIEDAKENFNKNLNDSEIKKTVDNWYKNNLNSYTNKLEDTVWCNDRTFANGSLKSKDTKGGGTSDYEGYFRNRNMYEPNVSCSNLNDSFTVSDTIGNGKLTYPVGLLTADEMTLAGFTSYLNAGTKWWTMTPHYFYYDSCIAYQNANGTYTFGSAIGGSKDRYVRPSVSLKNETLLVKGTGTLEDPYIVK